jgi:hypothetical protein
MTAFLCHNEVVGLMSIVERVEHRQEKKGKEEKREEKREIVLEVRGLLKKK